MLLLTRYDTGLKQKLWEIFHFSPELLLCGQSTYLLLGANVGRLKCRHPLPVSARKAVFNRLDRGTNFLVLLINGIALPTLLNFLY
jgi:hypothetical protein